VHQWSELVLTLSYSSKINGFYILRGFLRLWKKCCVLFSEGNGAPSVACDSPLQIVMAVWHTFFIWTSWVPVCKPSAYNSGCLARFKFKRGSQTTITICRMLSHPTRSLSRIVCREQERPKGRKGTLGPVSRQILDTGIFWKPMSP